MTPRLGAAIRLAIAVPAIDVLAIAIIPVKGAWIFASFAAVAALYFLDFDGSWREQLGGYAAATAVGLAGVVLGVVVAPVLWVAVAVAFVVSAAFAFARSLRGYVARSAIGVQLAFMLAVLGNPNPRDLPWYVGAWALGSAIATLIALTVFPRRHTGAVRKAVSAWCDRARALTLALGTTSADASMQALESARQSLRDIDAGSAIRPGMVSRRLRALNELRGQVELATRSLAELDVSAPTITRHLDPLAPASADGFGLAGRRVLLGSQPEPLVPLEQARREDYVRAGTWVEQDLANGAKSTDAAIADLRAHMPLRVLSVSAEVMQVLADRSRGAVADLPGLWVGTWRSAGRQLRDNLDPNSVWLRNALRAGIAVALAVLLARLLGLEHGFWVVMAALALLQASFSSGGTLRSALAAGAGTMLGIAVSAGLLWIAPRWWMALVLLPAAAFIAKFTAQSAWLGQAAFTPFAVLNVTVLSWPPGTGLVTVRLTDVLLGLVVGLGATLLVFPSGLEALTIRQWQAASRAAHRYLDAARASLGSGNAPESTELRGVLVDETTAFCSTVDAMYVAASDGSPDLRLQSAREAWLFQALVTGAILQALASQAPASGRLVQALATPGAAGRSVEEAARTLQANPQDLVAAVWASWWIDQTAANEPSGRAPEHPGRAAT